MRHRMNTNRHTMKHVSNQCMYMSVYTNTYYDTYMYWHLWIKAKEWNGNMRWPNECDSPGEHNYWAERQKSFSCNAMQSVNLLLLIHDVLSMNERFFVVCFFHGTRPQSNEIFHFPVCLCVCFFSHCVASCVCRRCVTNQNNCRPEVRMIDYCFLFHSMDWNKGHVIVLLFTTR